jgi:hypothetical protein
MLQQDLQSLNHQILARHQSRAEDDYQYIPYELIPIDDDPYEEPVGRPFSQRLPRQRLSSYESIGDSHYELMPIIHDPYEAPLRRSTSAPGTEYQGVVPCRMHKEGCDCRYCLDQTARDSSNGFTEEEGARSTEGILDGLSKITIEKSFPDGATVEFPLPYPLPKGFTDVFMHEYERNTPALTDDSKSRRRQLSRRNLRARMARIKDYIDDDFDGDWMRLEKIKEKEEEMEDANFISQLLSNVKKEPVSQGPPAFSSFTIPMTFPKVRQEEEKEAIPLSEFSFLEIHDQSNDFNDAEPAGTEKSSSDTDILADHITPKAIKQTQNDLGQAPENTGDADDKTAVTKIGFSENNNASNDKDKRCYRERNSVKESAKKSSEEHIVPAFCLAEVDFNVENSECESDSSDYLEPVTTRVR